jgi:hypothetical protein
LEHNFEIAARGSSPRTRSHVWHMKVLLYAVFKERGVDSPSAGDRITKDERIETLRGANPQS